MPVWVHFSLLFHFTLEASSILDLFENCWSASSSLVPRELLDLLPLLISWVLWKARNLLIFEGRELPVSAVIREVQQTLYDIYSVRELRAFFKSALIIADFWLLSSPSPEMDNSDSLLAPTFTAKVEAERGWVFRGQYGSFWRRCDTPECLWGGSGRIRGILWDWWKFPS